MGDHPDAAAEAEGAGPVEQVGDEPAADAEALGPVGDEHQVELGRFGDQRVEAEQVAVGGAYGEVDLVPGEVLGGDPVLGDHLRVRPAVGGAVMDQGGEPVGVRGRGRHDQDLGHGLRV
ncbi:hypothetical protein VR45_34750 [Streptomyces sp. NRRL S-495]|nr:hypothetical protein VR45_34750 [Streptomyces sp. NRRL S-495]